MRTTGSVSAYGSELAALNAHSLRMSVWVILAACAAFAADDLSRSFANPIDLQYRMRPESDKDFREGADPDVVMWDGRYWLFASKCGGYFVSDNLVTWRLVRTDDLPLEEYAPTAWVMDGRLHFSSRGGTVHRAVDAAFGKWEQIKGRVPSLDSKLFYENGRLFDYYGAGTNRIPLWVQEFDPSTFAAIGRRLPIAEMDDTRFGWDVRGDANDWVSRVGYKEGSYLTKRDGIYYFQCATPGTQFASYCDVALTGPSPLGPFVRQKLNPFSQKTRGYVKGAGHGCTFCDRHGNWWHLATCVISGVNRRIVMFPVFFDPDGEMWCDTAFADWPMVVPDRKAAHPNDFHSGWMPLTYAKRVSVSSCAPGSRQEAIVDEDMRTVWCAETGRAGEWAEVDLGGMAEVRAVQIGFAETEDVSPWRDRNATRKWRLDVSVDGKNWESAIGETDTPGAVDHPYRAFARPVRASKIRVVCMGLPAKTRFALREIRAFGRRNMSLPQPPTSFSVLRDETDRRRVRLSWCAVKDAEGYIVRYGPAPDKLHLSLMVRDACEAEVRSLDAQLDYWWTIEAFNAAGISLPTCHNL